MGEMRFHTVEPEDLGSAAGPRASEGTWPGASFALGVLDTEGVPGRSDFEVTEPLRASEASQAHFGVRSALNAFSKTTSVAGAAKLKEWFENPLRDRTAIEERRDAIQCLIDNPDIRHSLSQYLRDTQRLHDLDLARVDYWSFHRNSLKQNLDEFGARRKLKKVDQRFPDLDQEFELRQSLDSPKEAKEMRLAQLMSAVGSVDREQFVRDYVWGGNVERVNRGLILYDAKRLQSQRHRALLSLDDADNDSLRALVRRLSSLRLSIVDEDWTVPQVNGSESIGVKLSQARPNVEAEGRHTWVGNHPLNPVIERADAFGLRASLAVGVAVAVTTGLYAAPAIPGHWMWGAVAGTLVGGLLGTVGFFFGMIGSPSGPKAHVPRAKREYSRLRPRGISIDLEELTAQRDAFAELDALVSLAEVLAPFEDKISHANFREPGTGVQARGMHPPLLMLDGKETVGVDIDLKYGSGLFLTGSNSGGKSQTLKSLALGQWFAQTTGFAFAQEFETEVFEAIDFLLPEVTGEQDLANPNGRFGREALLARDTLQKILARRGNTLVIWDEWGQGANPEDSEHVTELVASGIVKAGGLLVMATQLLDSARRLVHEGYALTPGEERVQFRGLRTVDTHHAVPTFRFQEGVATTTNARAILDDLGLDRTGVSRMIERQRLPNPTA